MEITEALRARIREYLNNYADEISGGGCLDYATYRENVGVIRGLALAERELLDLVEKARNAD